MFRRQEEQICTRRVVFEGILACFLAQKQLILRVEPANKAKRRDACQIAQRSRSSFSLLPSPGVSCTEVNPGSSCPF